MTSEEDKTIKSRVDRIRELVRDNQGTREYYEAASLAQSVLFDTVGGSHPIMSALEKAVASPDWTKTVGATRSVLVLYDQGALKSPRLAIARRGFRL